MAKVFGAISLIRVPISLEDRFSAFLWHDISQLSVLTLADVLLLLTSFTISPPRLCAMKMNGMVFCEAG